MMHDDSWVELCEISESVVGTESKKEVAVHLFQPNCGSIVASAVSVRASSECNNSVVCIHPVLYDFLHQSVGAIQDAENGDSDCVMGSIRPKVEMIPLPMEPPLPREADGLETKLFWNMEILEIVNATDQCTLELCCVFIGDDISRRIERGSIHRESFFKSHLQGRLVRKKSVLLISTCFGYAFFSVSNVEVSAQISNDVVYRLGSPGSIFLRIENMPIFKANEKLRASTPISYHQGIPGYDVELNEIMATLCITKRNIAPAAILIAGPSGVGKSRLCSCIAHRFEQNGHRVSKISVQDLVFRANTTTDLYKESIEPSLQGCQLCVLDDLHLLETGDDDDTSRDIEYTIVQNCIATLIDKFSNQCRIMGISQVPSKLPTELTKINRLERVFHINPPTQEQREMIWMDLLEDEDRSKTTEKWSKALASSTAGCVAADLHQIYQDASTRRVTLSDQDQTRSDRWRCLRDASHTCIPSQLSDLDVVKPKLEDGDDGWSDFAAYSQARAHVMRNVVLPWRIFLRQMDQPEETREAWIQPPPGVLFHGPSGCGKTQAARCLAASLNLPTIQVRAADVLDKWLGGSEALLRSLFARARAASPCVLFLDEIDAIAINREEDDTQNLSSRILSTLLNEMDGVSSSITTSRVLVIACTNRLQALDSALLRPGRLQEHFHLDLPNTEELLEILTLRTKNIPLASDVTLADIARGLYKHGGTGADVEGLCREACLIALQNSEFGDEVYIGMEHILHAMREIRHSK
ncbi:unnamed protein product [Cylindrotheca closterium]|uniref:AAA+ ATPase domain-containing protein n=1 Tax=Cylindrotheca closterium TaxID=2856 RepID=A0AAD2CTD9_9STRA|nr:unnamed protein product [Cylindrotheca closterium]